MMKSPTSNLLVSEYITNNGANHFICDQDKYLNKYKLEKKVKFSNAIRIAPDVNPTDVQKKQDYLYSKVRRPTKTKTKFPANVKLCTHTCLDFFTLYNVNQDEVKCLEIESKINKTKLKKKKHAKKDNQRGLPEVLQSEFMEKELRMGYIASLQHSSPVIPQLSLPIIPQHSSPVIPQHSSPVIPQHSSPVFPQHSSPVIPQHSSPVIPQHSSPVIPQHSSPVIPQYSSPVIPHHSPKPIHLKTLSNEKNPIRNVKYVGNFRSEPLTSISSHKPPYEIGFVNPVGSNRCWLNASLQAILGMQLLIEDIVQYEKPSPSRVLAAFRELVLTRKTGSQLSTHSALQKLYQSLEDIDPVFVNGNQQDAPEFVNRLLDTFRNLFSQADYNYLLLELSSENQVNNVGGDFRINTLNPIKANIEFQLQETHICTRCESPSTTTEDNLILFVDIPKTASHSSVNLQDSIELYMQPAQRELNCDQCGNTYSEVSTHISKLPRYFAIQLKRYSYKNKQITKVKSMLKIPTYLCMKKCVTPEVTCPLSLICDKTEEVGTLQEAIEQRTEENVDLSYRIIGAVTHDGISHNSGHYMADVYNTEQQGWYHCDDENVFKSTEEAVLGHDQQHNGYLFFYIYRPLFDHLVQHPQ